MRLPSTWVQPTRSCVAWTESMVLVPTLHSLGHRPSHLRQKMLAGQAESLSHGPMKLLGGGSPDNPKGIPSPAAITGEAWRALSQAAALVDAEGGSAARHLPQMSTDLSGDAAPGLILVGAQRAGPEAGSLEVEVAASHTGTRVFRLAAAPQTFTVAALTVSCAGQPTGAGAHCGQRAVRPYLPLRNPSVMPFSHPGPPHLEMTFSALGISGFRLHYCFLPSRMLEGQQEASLCAPP